MSSEAVRDLMIETHAAVVELQAEVAVVATMLGKVSNNLLTSSKLPCVKNHALHQKKEEQNAMTSMKNVSTND